ncbi:unnamed protein product [Phytomonas sp. EM1]|nr:unnamed protein product [Phytomonas sp. EM1]|eukprot:CCW63752.1 unnamed protein product [Phytomonas sp. isolate EM1]
MNLVTTLFKVKRIPGSRLIGEQSLDNSSFRQQEYRDCLLHNLSHPGVDSILLLVEGIAAYRELCHPLLANRPLTSGSGKLIPILFSGSTVMREGRTPSIGQPTRLPTYEDLFRIANQLAPGTPCMVCNADIYLSPQHFRVPDVVNLFKRENASHPSFERESGEEKWKRVALALTRYESDHPRDAPLISDYRGSHDAFIVRPPLPESFLRAVAHPQNAYQAENIVIHELRRSGYTVLNPCLDLHIIHRHASGIRQWLPSVDPTRYGRAAPTTMRDVTLKLAQNI